MRIVRRASFNAVPWKNGGGITHEVLRLPADGPFLWRVSIAEIDKSGPFSDFAGYSRTMVLLRGAGIELSCGARPPTYLRKIGDLVEFDGALATKCELLEGPCTDFNLMVSKSVTGVRSWVENLPGSKQIPAPAKGTLLVFGIEGPLALEAGGQTTVLDPWDLGLTTGETSLSVAPAREHSAAPLAFFATLDDNSLLNNA